MYEAKAPGLRINQTSHKRQTKDCFKSIRISINRRRKRSPTAFAIAFHFSTSHRERVPIFKATFLTNSSSRSSFHLWKNSLLYHTRYQNPHSHPHLNPIRHQSQLNQTLELVQKLKMKLTIKSVFKKRLSYKESG